MIYDSSNIATYNLCVFISTSADGPTGQQANILHNCNASRNQIIHKEQSKTSLKTIYNTHLHDCVNKHKPLIRIRFDSHMYFVLECVFVKRSHTIYHSHLVRVMCTSQNPIYSLILTHTHTQIHDIYIFLQINRKSPRHTECASMFALSITCV